MTTIIDKLDHCGETDQQVWLFPAEEEEIALEQLATRSHRYAERLTSLGIGHQDRVALVMNNGSDYVALLLAIWRLNAIAVPLRPRGSKYTQNDRHLEYCDQVCHFALIVYDDSTSRDAFAQWTDDPAGKALSLERFRQLQPDRHEIPEVRIASDDIAVLQFSSGSTGQPKGVIVTHGMMMAQLQNIAENHTASRNGTAPQSMASWMPIHHDLGLFIGVLSPIFCGCRNVLAPPNYYMRNPARWFSLLAEHRVDFTFSTNSAVATTCNAIRRLQNRGDIDLSELHIYLAAEKVSAVTVRRCWQLFQSLGMPREQLHIGYGMAENTLGCACTKTPLINIRSFVMTEQQRLIPDVPNTPGSFELVAVGHADRHHDITIRDAAGEVLPELRLGEIHIESPCVSPGYYNNPAVTAVSFPEGRFRSGDLGFYYHGELYFHSRRDDMIIVGGRNIIPQDIEEDVETLDFVRPTTTCLVSRENCKTGVQELLMLIESDANCDSETLEMRSAKVRQLVLSGHGVLLSHIVFCGKGSIEKTSSGKKRRKVIRDRLFNHQIETIGADYA